MWDNHSLCTLRHIQDVYSILILNCQKTRKTQRYVIVEWVNKGMFSSGFLYSSGNVKGGTVICNSMDESHKKKPDIHAYVHYETPQNRESSNSWSLSLSCGVRSQDSSYLLRGEGCQMIGMVRKEDFGVAGNVLSVDPGGNYMER